MPAASALAGSAKLSWGPSPSSDVGGYKVYIGKASRQYTANVDVAQGTSYTFDGLAGGTTYYFAVTAYNSSKTAESDFSNEVSKFLPADTLTASFTATPATGASPLEVTLTPSVSGQVTGWSWDFGDGTNSADTTATVPPVSRSYTKAGRYTVSLTVDGAAGSVTQSATVTVSPVARFTASTSAGTAPASISFSDGSTGGATAWQWNFGDGTTSTEQNPSHTYTSAGTYTVSLKVTGGGISSANTASQSVNITAADAPLTAALTAAPASGDAPLRVTLTPAITGKPSQWSWDFGDGTADGGTGSAVAPVTRTYAKAGTYAARLTVSGASGKPVSAGTMINVAPKSNFVSDVGSGDDPLAVRFSDTSAGAPDQWEWDFGDGSSSTEQNPSHSYTAAGSYTVSLNVSGGGISSAAAKTATIAVGQSPRGLVAAYAFDERDGTLAADASGNGHTATIENALWLKKGRFGSALFFNGNDAKLTVRKSPALRLTREMTLEAWIKPQPFDDTPRDILFKGGPSGPSYYLMAGSGALYRPVSGITIDGAEVQTSSQNDGLPKNAWTHLAATYDGETLRLYVNGWETASRLQPGGLASSSGDLEIGGDSFGGNHFRGAIDEIRIYDRAMSSDEIKADRKSAVAKTHPPQPLLGSDTAGDARVSIPAGGARAYQLPSGTNGVLTQVSVELAGGAPSRGLIVGVYSDQQNQPGELLAQSKRRIIPRGKPVRIPLPATEIATGDSYWIAVLNPKGGGDPAEGRLMLRGDRETGGLISNSSAAGLSRLPSNWTGTEGNGPVISASGAGYPR